MTSLTRWAADRGVPGRRRENVPERRERARASQKPVPKPVRTRPPPAPAVRRAPLERWGRNAREDPHVLLDRFRAWSAEHYPQRAECPVLGHGDPEARVLVLVRAPGPAECRRGVALSGPALEAVQAWLAPGGYRVARGGGVFVSGASVYCTPPGGPLADGSLAASRPLLDALVGAMRPHWIVACGAEAARAVLGGTGRTLEGMRGAWRAPRPDLAPWRGVLWPCEVRATYHPAYALRSPRRTAAARADFEALEPRRR